MKQEKTSQLSFGDLQMQRRKVKSEFFKKSEFFNQINAVIDWHPLRALIEPAYAKGFSPAVRATTAWCCSAWNSCVCGTV